MKRLIIYLSAFLILYSCKKEPVEIIEQNEISWDDTQKVRILKVEQTESPNSYPFDTDDLMTVEYRYSENNLVEIVVSRSYQTITYLVSNNSLGNRDIDFSADDGLKWELPGFPVFEKINILTDNGRFVESKNDYEVSMLPYLPAQSVFRNIDYVYGEDGLLKSAKSMYSPESFIQGANVFGIKINTEAYKKGNLEKYTIQKFQPTYLTMPIGQELSVNINYTASNLPDGLVRLINQAILGLPDIGFEDYLFHGFYDIRPESDLLAWDTEGAYAIHIENYHYTFADWMISLGLNDVYVIPNQGNQLIASKHIIGKKLVDGKVIGEDGEQNPIYEYEYAPVDSVANYPYTHHVESKILEIAGLKIYYELVE